MASVVGASSTAGWVSNGAPSAALPAGWAAGDVLVALVGARNTGATFTAPAGWTQRAVSTASTATGAAVYTKTAAVDETAPTFGTGVSTQPSGAVIIALRDVDEASVVAAMNSGTGTGIIFDEITTPADGSVVLLFDFEGDDNSITAGPSGYTLAFSETTLIGSDAGLHAWDTIQATAGPTGSPTATMSGSDPRTRATVALAPSASTTPATVSPSAAVATFTGAAQVAAASLIAAGAALASFTAPAPQVTAAVTISPPAAVASWTGPTGVIAAPATIAPPAAVASFQADAPTVEAGTAAPVTVNAPAAQWSATAVPPTVTAGATLAPPAGRATWSAAAPTIAAGTSIAATVSPPAARATYTAPAPGVSGAVSINAPAATATAAATPPTVTAAATIAAPPAETAWTGTGPLVVAGSVGVPVRDPVLTLDPVVPVLTLDPVASTLTLD